MKINTLEIPDIMVLSQKIKKLVFFFFWPNPVLHFIDMSLAEAAAHLRG